MASNTRKATIHALPDDILLSIFRLLPQHTATSPCGGFSVSSRGGVERVCRQWRALALSPALPVSADINTRKLTDGGLLYGAELHQNKLVHLLPPRRTVEKLLVKGDGRPDDFELSWHEFPRLLPSVTSVRLVGYEGLFLAQHLTRCVALRELEICLAGVEADAEEGDVWTAETLRALGSLTALKRLRLDLRTEPCFGAEGPQQQVPRRLTECIDGCLTALEGLSLLYAGPSEACPLPRALRELSVALVEQSQVPALAALLPRCSRLERLCIHDDEWATQEILSDELLFLPGLDDLPRLRQLHCAGRIPPQAWRCPSLQVLSARMCSVDIPPGLDHVLPSLRRLRFTSCSLPDHGFPAALCAARQLSSIVIQDTELEGDHEGGGLPPEMSRLTSLQRLVIHGARYMEPSDMAALCPLTSLTELHLEDCGVHELPLGRCLASLQVLNIAQNYYPDLVPPELRGARRLRALSVSPPLPNGDDRNDAPPPRKLGLADWRHTKAVLDSMHSLKLLHVSGAWNGKEGAPHAHVAPTLGLLRSELGLVPRTYGEFDAEFYPQHSQHDPYEDAWTDWE